MGLASKMILNKGEKRLYIILQRREKTTYVGALDLTICLLLLLRGRLDQIRSVKVSIEVVDLLL